MKTKILFGSLALTVILVSGCGKQNAGPGVEPGTDSCSSEFISDFSKVRMAVGSADMDPANAENLVGQFEAKYRGVSCQAQVTRRNQLQSSVETVRADALVAEWRAAIAQVRRN